jgi:hypothetical protein
VDEVQIMISRMQRMLPANGSPHLARFKEEFRKHGRYSMIPVSAECVPDFELAIEKRKVHFRKAGEIQRGDLDSAVLLDERFDRSSLN